MQDTMLPTDTEPASSPGAVRGRRRRSYMSSSCLASGSSSRPAALRMASRPLRSNSSRPSSVSRAHLEADGGLGEGDLLGCFGEGAVMRHRQESAQETDGAHGVF